jgi:hypothetical protein
MAATTSLSAYDVRVSLMHIRPEIWRLIRVPADIRMDQLHYVLQIAFGWTDSHMHQFHVIDAKGVTKAFVGRPDPDFAGSTHTQDETKRRLKNFLTKAEDYIGYEYDFGDSWLHEIKLTAVHAQSARLSAPLCLDGARACPPEDCGGVPGFERVLAASANPKLAETDLMEWLGDYDPTTFDLSTVNRALARIKV